MTRRIRSIKLRLAFTIASLCLGMLAVIGAERPNILFCLADDMSWLHTSIDGDPAIQTPNFDKLAKAGVRFQHAYCSAPSCTPSRAATLTGQAFCRLEEGASLLSTLPGKFSVYPDILEKAGYAVGYAGKGWDPGDWRPAGRTRNPAGPEYASFRAFVEKLETGKPFCFWLGSHDPHRPYKPNSGIKAGIDPSKIIVPPIVPDSPEVRADIADYLYAIQRFDRDVGKAVSELQSRGLLTNTLIAISSDNGMPYPRGKCNLYDWGTRMPLAFSWAGHIPTNRLVTDIVSLTDLAPTFLEAAGLQIPREMTGRSLLPLLLSGKAGRIDKNRDEVFFGRERHDTFRREGELKLGYPMRAIRTDDYLYIRNFKPDRIPSGDSPVKNQDNDRGPAKAFVVRQKDDQSVRPFYQRAYGLRPAEELYDLAKDPKQWNNVAPDKAYETTLAKMRLRLDTVMTTLEDPRRPNGPNPDVFDTYPTYSRPRTNNPE